MSITNVKVEKNNSEPAASTLRRFQKRVQESGVLPRVRSIRYASRPLSDVKVKRAKLKKIGNSLKYAKLKRLGVQIERKKRR